MSRVRRSSCQRSGSTFTFELERADERSSRRTSNDAVYESNRRDFVARRRAAAQRPSVDLPRRRRRTSAPRRATSCRSAVRADGRSGRALYSDRSQIALRMLIVRRRSRLTIALIRAASSRRRSRFASRSAIDATRVPAGARRSRPAAVADRRSLRRLPGRAGAVAGHGSAAAGAGRRCSPSCCSRAASSRATIRGRASLEGLEQRVEVLAGDVPESRDGDRDRHRVRRRSPARPEDRPVSRPAGEPRGGGRLRARPAARLLQLQRRLRAGAGPLAATRRSRIDVSEDAVARIRAERGAQRRRRRRARRQRVRRAARPRAAGRAVRHHRARSAGLRQEQGGGRRTPAPATRRSTCAR